MTTTNTKRIIYHTWKAPVGIAMASSLLPLAIIAIIARATGHEPITQVAEHVHLQEMGDDNPSRLLDKLKKIEQAIDELRAEVKQTMV
jgi:uncharacterized membrane protein YhiD involved in acid resistance